MNQHRKIAVIGANQPLYTFYEQAAELGYEIYGFAWAEGAVCEKFCKKFYPIDFRRKEEILQICRSVGVEGITSFSLESAIPTVIYVAAGLNLVQNAEEALPFLQDKFTMRQAMKKAGVTVPDFHHVTSSADLPKDINFPVIVKPVDNGGKRGVSLAHDDKDLKDALTYALDNSKRQAALIEAYVPGREFSVEYLSFKGKHYFMQLTDKVNTGAPHFVETEHHQPADVTPQQLQAIRHVTEQTLTALHITDSPSHTEVKLNDREEVVVIEVGARLGGDSITSDLVRLSTGIDMVAESLKLATGDFTPITSTTRAYASKYYYVPGKEWMRELIRQKPPCLHSWDGSFKETMPIDNGARSAWAICVSKEGRVTQDTYQRLA